MSNTTIAKPKVAETTAPSTRVTTKKARASKVRNLAVSPLAKTRVKSKSKKTVDVDKLSDQTPRLLKQVVEGQARPNSSAKHMIGSQVEPRS